MRTRRRESPWRGVQFFILLLLAIALLPSVVGLTRAMIKCQPWVNVEATSGEKDPLIQEAVKDIPEYARPEDLTYLTLPEWYIVYSTDEYAAFIAQNPPSQFPYFRAVGQYWQSYAVVCDVVRGKYPFNGEHQFALSFIGISFTAENMLKGVYEGTIGRISEWTASEPTEEDIYAAQVAKEYGEFLHMTPWYFFPFREKLQGLWQETSLSGPNLIRKSERKLSLTIEYGLKVLYAGFTRLGAQATYGGADVEKIYAVTDGFTQEVPDPDLELIKKIDGDRQLVRITRFEYFSYIVPRLIENGVQFIEIAGNDDILFTLLGPQDGDYNFEHGEHLFSLPILTQPGLTRVAINVRVPDISAFLQELKSRSDVQFEHMYDY
jgi:hypothetical protein